MKNKATAQDYRREMNNLLNKIEKLQQESITRLHSLCCQYPDVPIALIKDENGVGLTDIKAKSFVEPKQSKKFIESLDFDVRIMYIETVEKWLADQHPHVQLSIDYNS